MNRRQFGIAMACALCAITAMSSTAQQSKAGVPKEFTMDAPTRDFTLADLMHDRKPSDKPDSALVSLAKFRDKKSVILFFMSEGCSVTWRYEKRMGELMKKFGKQDVVFMGVRCSSTDTPEGIRKFAESKNFVMPLLNDTRGELTSFFKVINTPTFVLIDKKGVVRWSQAGFSETEEQDLSTLIAKLQAERG